MRAYAAPSTQALRGWQRRALVRYLTAKPRDFLAVATPGAGKTTFALRIAGELLTERTVDQVVVVVPTEHLKTQWAEAAARVGMALDPKFSNSTGQTSSDYHGIVVTYAQVASHPTRHRVRTENHKTLVIFDEVHHGGDAKSWGEAIREAYDDATRRLCLTGTPFRSDDSPIPFVQYEPDGSGHQQSVADHTYGYSDALADGVVRPVVFMAYSGEARWRDSAGEEHAARLGEPLTAEQTARAWRTALNPEGEWMPAVIAAANKRLGQLRQSIPDAGGMIIATDQTTARAYAKLLHTITGEEATVILSDDPTASARISQFSEGTSRWLVAVRMVSEGVDVPRLAVGVYATSASTPLFFAQAIGRFVRLRRKGETASIFLPSVPNLLELASELERERNHVLGKPHREPQGDEDPLDGGRYAVQSYLEYQGKKLVSRFDAGSYVSLSEALSSHDVGRGRGGVEAALRACPVPVVVGGITSDRLYPLRLQEELADLLPGCDGLNVLDSIYGHDGFLVESEAVGALIQQTLRLAAP